MSCLAALAFSGPTHRGQKVVVYGPFLSSTTTKPDDESENGIHYCELVRGNPKQKTIALTFDDGPHPKWTPQLLALLKKLDVPATFFLVGKMVDAHPELAKMEADAGFELANHTYDHLRLPGLSHSDMEFQLREGANAFKRAVGYAPKLYRPPGGEYDSGVIDITKKLGMTMVLWTDDPGDWLHPSTKVIEDKALHRISNGGIILLHDGIKETLQVLPEIVAKLRADGYQFVTCRELALQKGVIKTGGPRVPFGTLRVQTHSGKPG